ncbi:LysR substrate-binding domain-containing protein [Antarcticirhabdus aurantiaca]|uniref:LysR substrate-binding domain-containing protein n=1 Tax=Antarcticirhabdus aurantiaca TaxID=2606717 RepID=A0ACD4NJL3_9HYPH|nr:LysR substrate-binding domain-containing protein [Antarcticirhabdus aurantiaca]WAJ26931.1 LysR substrate-binding domain-containing protein [Jeongeuplla avenae]
MKALNRVHLNGLRAAEAAARLGSLPAAAAELGVTAGAVSQHILKLERQMGRTLFERTARGLPPTVAGAPILAQIGRGLAEIDSAVAKAFRDGVPTLNLSVAPVFAAKWLVPRLAKFGRLHPEVRVRLEASTVLVDPDRDDVDLAIRVGPGGWRRVAARFLLPQEVFPVVSPAHAADLREPADLLRLPIVRDLHSTIPWSIWLDRHGIAEDALAQGPSFNDASLCLDAVIAGQGAMLAWDTLAMDALADGRVVAPFPHRAATGLGYWLIASESRRPSAAMRLFSDWIVAEMAQRPTRR